MTARLREVLHDAAVDVPAYPVYEQALATVRRRRRRTRLTAAAALVVVALITAVLPSARTPSVGPAAGVDAALPDRVGLPPIGTLHATDRPRLGPASVIFTGQAPRLIRASEGSNIAVVSANSDRYRTIKGESGAQAGEDTLLSPDGHQVAFRTSGVRVVDLTTTRSRTVTSGVPDSLQTEPAAWSPDGRALVVRDTVPANPQRSAYRTVLSLVWLDGNRRIRLADEYEASISPVAFTPDGTRLAFQTDRTVTITDLAGRQLAAFPLAPDTELAGKGAWSTDGRSLTVTRRDADRWALRQVDATTGRDLGALELPTVSGVTAIRLLGWAADGSARVVAYLPAPTAPGAFDRPLDMEQRLAYGNVDTVQVLALDRGAESATILLTAPADVVAIDVAERVIQGGLTRAANPPLGVGPRLWYWAVVGTIAIAVVVAYLNRAALMLWWGNRKARRASSAPQLR
ncbi:TolB family protein [Micromonospora sp. DT229]|uniref:TolB family protein n=1 Tax=Micromonospora sp. DT229 TaxID=3393430 RepID=UPI003CF9B626